MRSVHIQPKRVALALAVCVQIGVPLFALGHGVPSRFGFHMFSGREVLRVEVVNRQGDAEPASINRWVANRRPELDWTRHLPERMCEDYPRGFTVTVSTSDNVRSFACSG